MTEAQMSMLLAAISAALIHNDRRRAIYRQLKRRPQAVRLKRQLGMQQRKDDMQTVTMYEAKDGKQFRSEAQCLEYEQQCDDLAAANDMLDNGATLMAALTRAHQTRPWWESGLSLEDKVILMKTTKDTGFVVSHWQCSDKPGYKPCGLNHAGQVRLWGDAGCWSGPYGNWVGLADLLRYARNTVREHA